MTTTTNDLVGFLLARIADAEAAAHLIEAGEDWHPTDECTTCDATRAARAKYGDPARVLADCEAKRRIVKWAKDWPLRPSRPSDEDTILGLLALPYAGHPDYREEWRP